MIKCCLTKGQSRLTGVRDRKRIFHFSFEMKRSAGLKWIQYHACNTRLKLAVISSGERGYHVSSDGELGTMSHPSGLGGSHLPISMCSISEFREICYHCSSSLVFYRTTGSTHSEFPTKSSCKGVVLIINQK